MWEELAERFQQLYLTPGEEGAAQYRAVVRQGKDAARKDLSGFIQHPADCMTVERTPAGEVSAVCVHERADFERFLQIMANRCQRVIIPATQGAAILDGLIDWPRVRAHKAAYMAETMSHGETPDWNGEFRRFTADKRNYTTALIVLSWGPYSGLDAGETGLSREEWLEKSFTIRKYHECTHFVCRRLYPEKKDAVWDELVADAVGLLAAFGTYRPDLAEKLLGIREDGYAGGRLENYVKDGTGPEGWVPYCRTLVRYLEKAARALNGASPYDLAVHMEERKEKIESSLPASGI